MKKRISKRYKELLDKFLLDINVNLKRLTNILRKSKNYKDIDLNYSLNSITEIEKYYLDVQSGSENPGILKEELDIMFETYIGETVIKHLGGRWVISDLPSDDAFLSPVVIDWGKEGSDHITLSPKIWRQSLLEEKEIGKISEYIENCKNIDDLFNDIFNT